VLAVAATTARDSAPTGSTGRHDGPQQHQQGGTTARPGRPRWADRGGGELDHGKGCTRGAPVMARHAGGGTQQGWREVEEGFELGFGGLRGLLIGLLVGYSSFANYLPKDI
jgi:hypothetical protein